MIKIELSYPPSVNNYYGRTRFGSVYIKKPGQEHILDTARRFMESGLDGVGDSRLCVIVELHRYDNRKYDIDNTQKCVLDSCTKAGIWDDDSQIDQLLIRRAGLHKGGKAVVSIYEVGKDDFEIERLFPKATTTQDKEIQYGAERSQADPCWRCGAHRQGGN